MTDILDARTTVPPGPDDDLGADTSPTWRERILPRRGVPLGAWQWRAVLLVLGIVALGARLFRQQQSYDLFIDEPFYTQVGQSVARGSLPYAAGVHFFLHPPGFFLLEAPWIKVFGAKTDAVEQVYSLRKLISIFAALTVVLVAVVVSRAVNRTAGLVAAGLYLVNTFVNRDSAIVILEPSTIFFALFGYAVLLHLRPPDTRARRWQLLGAGLLMGISVLCKEFAVFITIVPMLVALVIRTPLARREALLVAGTSTVPYLVWMVVVAATGNWGSFVFQLSTGFSRSAGATQITGFNRPGAPSFLDTLLKNIDTLWTAYLVLGLGSLAILYLVFRVREPRLKLVGCFGLGALPLISYCITLGTNEEQFFMFLLPAALMCLTITVFVLWRRWGRWWRAAVLVVALAVVVSDVVNYTVIHTQRDDGSTQVDRWMAANVPLGTVVGVTNSVQREMFTRYTMVDDNGGPTIGTDVRYLVVFYKQVEEGYAFVDRRSLAEQTRGMTVVYETYGRSNGRMVVYAVP